MAFRYHLLLVRLDRVVERTNCAFCAKSLKLGTQYLKIRSFRMRTGHISGNGYFWLKWLNRPEFNI